MAEIMMLTAEELQVRGDLEDLIDRIKAGSLQIVIVEPVTRKNRALLVSPHWVDALEHTITHLT